MKVDKHYAIDGIQNYILDINKQLARKTQECEELKNKNKKISKYWIKSDEKLKEYKMALETTFGALQFYKQCSKEDENKLVRKTQECVKLKSEGFTREELITLQEKDIDRYRKALEEIEKFCITYSDNHDAYVNVYKYILDIINKAKGKNDVTV